MDKKPQKTTLLRIRTIAVTETLLAIGALLIINLFFFNGDRFVGVSPHPFWFVVILISAQYGVWEGTFATLVATLAFLIGNVRPRGEGEYLYSYLFDVDAQPLLWLVSAFILGSLRFRHIVERDRLRNELAEAAKREEIVATQYEHLRSIKETLEQRLVKQFNTAVDIYKAAKLMETYKPTEILEGLQELVRVLLNPRKFSVFMLNEEALEVYLEYAWASPDEFAKTIPSTQRLYEEVIGNKRLVCIANADDEQILQHQGMLAGPIMSENGKILGMLKIEDIGFSDLHVSTLETFQIVCTWIANAYFQAEDYQKISGLSVINPDNNIFSFEFFKQQINYVTYLAKRFKFEVALVTMTFIFDEATTREKYEAAVQSLREAIEKNLRNIDQMFNYQTEKYTYRVLLPGTSEENTQLVISKIQNAFEAAQQEAGTHVKLSFAAQTLQKGSADYVV